MDSEYKIRKWKEHVYEAQALYKEDKKGQLNSVLDEYKFHKLLREVVVIRDGKKSKGIG